MNTAEQILRKRNNRLEQEVKGLENVLITLLEDLELAESMACAFAWDVGTALEAARKEASE